MTLYTHKDENIRKTWLLFSAFLIVVIGIGWFFSYLYQNSVILYGVVAFAVFMNIFSYWFSDKIVLSMAHAQPIEKKDNPDLYNLVENLCITAGLPMPRVYIVHEEQPNAFATGRDPKHAVVAVTQGLLDRLNRSELEGVIAHELSHVGNRDMLLSTAVVVLVGFISILSDMFMRSALWGSFSNRDDREGGQAGTVLLIIGIVVSILAPISAQLMHLAISRKREFLADASGALLTRYPEGLASALEKISQSTTPMSVASSTTAHLWLDDPFKGAQKTSWLHKIFMTHPPAEDRIAVLRGMHI
ncbi:MAG: Protease HtpX-like protein [Candidatus Wolfebacteria bacterium GW2011_GWC2_46_275]|uniref:Protease HtpX homolog n=2 Tax=Candidatus Wolfeibacteriota TaxID=1752735 RepID=A0A0G1WGM3_9BACT|nr:MAG: peptidase M48 Ste24p, heat shock protein HtpX [Candidatus Wolfebacteria bacterium GW2011_GWB1_47_1]KKU34824.1 MAG: Protease HtpX-like protein [Candidatus Wolfebacteria bacterium GW2011_GWC2_46_275]KKU42493.1 MAG: Protease HtpX-like protein [Candidatus Wolfebacteria bacterium GW2011_GWB2_46_69]KKU54278.1 MAG: Protease HtpX-like protein [Candidatus Wolfebacteria bacterium GW2011_GWC1_47_103]KKU59646.1 MAG: Protease HtpX-like protein [Candidatus Wolfebacteria bacterium GW2011_GWE2_47_12]K